jgi:hypothetical protein
MKPFPWLLLVVFASSCRSAPPPAPSPSLEYHAPAREIPPDEPTPRFVAPKVMEAQLATDRRAPEHRVVLPPALAKKGASYWSMVKVCVSSLGKVTNLAIVKSAHPLVDPDIVAALRTWRFHPYHVNGQILPFCSNVRYSVTSD